MTIREFVSKAKGRVYVFFEDDETRRRFVEDASKEGYHYGDGATLSERKPDRIMAINRDGTINFVGFAGRIAFGGGFKKVGEEKLIRWDYKEFLKKEQTKKGQQRRRWRKDKEKD